MDVFGLTVKGRTQQNWGSNIASANELTLSMGNTVTISGTTQINLVNTVYWQVGSIIRLKFSSTPIIKHNYSPSSDLKPIFLQGGTDKTAKAGSTITLKLASDGWYEINGVSKGIAYEDGLNNIYTPISEPSSKTTANNNILFGYGAGASLTEGSYNVFQGYEAGNSVTTTSYNTMLGFGAGKAETGSYKLYIDAFNSTRDKDNALIYGEGDTPLLNLNANVNIKNTLTVDTINEYTTDAGVTIEGILLKDGGLVATSTLKGTTGIFTSLTDGYIPYHQNDTNGLINSVIFQSGTNVGIGTITPAGKLHITGEDTYIEAIIENTLIGGQAAGFSFKNSEQEWKQGINSYNDWRLQDTTSGSINVFTIEYGAIENSLYIKSGGNIGLRTDNPIYPLSIYGISTVDFALGGNDATGRTGIIRKDYASPYYLDIISGANPSGNRGAIRFLLSDREAGEVMRITSDAKVAIGNTSATALLSISQNMSNYTSSFTSPHLNLLALNTVDTTGFVGITYAASTSVNYGWSVGALRSSAGQSDFTFKHHSNSVGGTEVVRITSTGSVGIGDSAPNQLLGLLGTNAQISIEESDTEFLRIGVGETAGTSIIGWDDSDKLYLGVYSSPTDTTITPLVTILSTGLVGIGTTAPASGGLHLDKAYVDINGISDITSASGNFTVSTTDSQSADIGGTIILGGRGNSTALIRAWAGIKGGKTNSTSTSHLGYLAFYTASSSVELTEKMRITDDGNVGIGTVTPSYLLEVNGTGHFVGAVTMATSLTLASGVSVTAILDEDSFVSNSNTALATQQSIRAYVLANATSGSYLDNVLEMQVDTTTDPTATPTTGDRYIVLDTSNINTNFKGGYADIATWLSTETVGDNDIVEFDGTNFAVAYDSSAASAGVTVTVGLDKNAASDHDWYYNTTDDMWYDRGEAIIYTAGTGIDITAYVVSLSHLGIESLADPDNDRIMFWDESEGAMKWLAVDSTLNITETTLKVADNTYQLLDADLTAIAALTGNNGFLKTDGAEGWSVDTNTYLKDTDDTFTGTLTITGAATVSTTLGVTGVLTANGGAVFNETGADVDFRIEGVGNPNAFFVHGSDGNVGIGIDAPSGKLHVQTSANSGETAQSTADDLVIEINGDGGISILTSNTTTGRLNFGDAANADVASIRYDHNTNKMYFDISGSTDILTLYGDSVGIGTSTPVSLTEIQGGLTTTGAVLTLGTKETTVVANDVLGRINFYAPLEASGTDAILIGASIVAIAEGEFSATSNATSLQFRTGSSEAATTKMTLTSAGNLTLTGSLGITGTRVTKGWFTDLEVTNAIAGSITGTAAIATTITLVATNSTDATHYPLFTDAATGNENPRTDTGFTYNPSSGLLTALGFSGALSGSATSLKSPATTGLAQLTGMGAGSTRVKTVRDANDTILELGGSYTPTGTWTSIKLNEAVALTTTSTKLNYLTSATGTTGTASTKIVFSTSPTLVTPTLGVATATSINKVTITAPTTSATLTLVTGSSLITSGGHSLTLTTTNTTVATLPAGTNTLAANNQTMYIGTTGVAINRVSAALTLAGITHPIGGHSATAWRMFYSNATTSAVQELAFGTSGKVLTSNGASAAPTWETVATSQWTTSGSNIYYNTGNVAIGTTPNDNMSLYISDSYSNSNSYHRAIQAKLTISGSQPTSNSYQVGLLGEVFLSTGAYDGDEFAGVAGQADVRGSGTISAAIGIDVISNAYETVGISDGIYGIRSKISNNKASGTVTNAYGIYSSVSVGSASTTTNAYGIYINGWSESGTFTNTYGIYIGTSIDSGSTSYAIYSVSTSPAYFAGKLGVGTMDGTGGAALYRVASGSSSGYLSLTSSSKVFKTNIVDISDTSWVYKLRPVEFEYKTILGDIRDGLIAEEVLEVDKRLIWYEKEKLQGVHYDRLIVPILSEVQKHELRIKELETEVKELRSQLNL